MANATTPAIQINEGNVGIGTTIPSQKLHLHNGTLLIDSDAGISSGIWLPDLNGNPSLRIVTDQASAGYSSIVNAWGSPSNAGVMVGSTRNDGFAFQVRSGVTLTDGFANDTGSSRMVVLGNGNVGIGTTTPNSKLDVSDGTIYSIKLSNTTAYNSGINNGIVFNGIYNSSGNNTDMASIRGGKETVNNTDFGGKLTFHTRLNGGVDTERMRITSEGELRLTGNGVIKNQESGGNFTYLQQTSSDSRLYVQYSQPLLFGTNATERMRITSGGNVGIGTTGPGAKLVISGGGGAISDNGFQINSSYGYSGTGVLEINPSAASHIPLSILSKNGQTANLVNVTSFGGTAGNLFNVQSSGNVGIGTTTPLAKLDIQGTQGQLFSVTDDLSGDIFSVADISGVPILNVNSDGTSYFDGNVGIGASSPSAKLDVKGDGADFFLQSADYKIARIQPRGTGADLDKGLFSLFNGNTESVRIDTASNSWLNGGAVGIGTTSPIGMLSVVNPISNSNTWTPTNNPDLWVSNAGTSNSYYAFGVTTNSGDIFSITNAGNVGIGTTSPSYPLVVNGEIDASGDGYLINGSGWATESSDVLTLGDWDGNEFSTRIMDQWSNEVLRVTDGRVGIGTTGPLATLHVDNPQTANGNIGFILDAAAGGTGTRNMHISVPDYGEGIRFLRSGTYSGGAMKFYSGTSNVGGVQINASSTSFNTTSDYRAKENVVPMENSINRLKELKPCRFNFIIEPENTVDGFIAHEAQEVVPEAVTGEKDKLNYEGNPEYQGIDQSKIVPLLTSALQEAISKIEQLETRIQTLENN